jgi:UTP--glucose-1-phosphate uridylyltransferase
LEAFYKMVDDSTVVWVNQSEPRGFGDAVLKAKSLVGSDRFLVHAGDSHFISKNAEHLRRVVRMSEESKADALFLSMEVEDPSRFGIVEGEAMADGLVKVKRVVEKPAKPASKLAIMPVYAFDSNIFKALEETKAGLAGELQLTDGIQQMVEWDLNVYTTKVASSEIWLDIGSPDLFWQAQNVSHKYYSHEPVP